MKKFLCVFAITAIIIFTVRPALALAEDSVELPAPAEEPVVEPVVTPEEIPSVVSDPTPAPVEEPVEEEPVVTETPSTTPETLSESIATRFTENTGTSGRTPAAPVIKAVWEMQGPAAALRGTDNSSDKGAQFLPSGQYQVSKPIAVCAVVSDSSGVADIEAVTADLYYPLTSFGLSPAETDGRNGCGQQKGGQYQMMALAKDQGLTLFCDTIQQNNPNLPEFFDIADFAGICGAEGDLQKDTAAVFCSDATLAYDDVAGDYKVLASAKDKAGELSNEFNGTFSYLELTAFETDFVTLNYGNVELNAIKTVEGDEVWQEAKGENHSTVRNVGNTRMQMEVTQDDMGLGKTEGEWNIRYGSKVGTEGLWINYWPEETILFDTIFGLSQMGPVDFAITVLRFPEDNTTDYSGKLTLNAKKAEPLACEPIQE